LTVRGRSEQFPDAARRLLAGVSKPADLWGRFPDDALLAVASRLDTRVLLDFLDGFLTPPTRKALHDSLDRNLGQLLGKNDFKEVLPAVGPDWGLCLMAPPAGEKAWFPQSVLTVRVRPGDKDAPLDQALLSTIHSYALLGVISYNSRHKDKMALKTVRHGSLNVKYLANDKAFPPGLQPAFALHDGYLVLASSPEAVRRFAAMPAAAGGDKAGGDVPLLRMSLKELRQYLTKHREPLIAAAAEANKVTPEEARRGLDGLLAVGQLFDRLELSHRASAGQVTLTLRVQPARSLKK
jgi:hypothetical protein